MVFESLDWSDLVDAMMHQQRISSSASFRRAMSAMGLGVVVRPDGREGRLRAVRVDLHKGRIAVIRCRCSDFASPRQKSVEYPSKEHAFCFFSAAPFFKCKITHFQRTRNVLDDFRI